MEWLQPPAAHLKVVGKQDQVAQHCQHCHHDAVRQGRVDCREPGHRKRHVVVPSGGIIWVYRLASRAQVDDVRVGVVRNKPAPCEAGERGTTPYMVWPQHHSVCAKIKVVWEVAMWSRSGMLGSPHGTAGGRTLTSLVGEQRVHIHVRCRAGAAADTWRGRVRCVHFHLRRGLHSVHLLAKIGHEATQRIDDTCTPRANITSLDASQERLHDAHSRIPG